MPAVERHVGDHLRVLGVLERHRDDLELVVLRGALVTPDRVVVVLRRRSAVRDVEEDALVLPVGHHGVGVRAAVGRDRRDQVGGARPPGLPDLEDLDPSKPEAARGASQVSSGVVAAIGVSMERKTRSP
jgi:hypothetical protein